MVGLLRILLDLRPSPGGSSRLSLARMPATPCEYDRRGLLQLDPFFEALFPSRGLPPFLSWGSSAFASQPTFARSSTPASRSTSPRGSASRSTSAGRGQRPVLFRLRGFAPPWRVPPSVRRRFVAPCCQWRFAAFRTVGSAGCYSADGPRGPRDAFRTPRRTPLVCSRTVSPRPLPSCLSRQISRHRAPERALEHGYRRGRIRSRPGEPGRSVCRSRVRSAARPCGRRRSGASASGSCAPPHPRVRCGRASADPIAGIPDAAARRCAGADRLPDLHWVLCVATWAASMRRNECAVLVPGELNRRRWVGRDPGLRPAPTVACRHRDRGRRTAPCTRRTRARDTGCEHPVSNE
jgi:hypothetical protein